MPAAGCVRRPAAVRRRAAASQGRGPRRRTSPPACRTGPRCGACVRGTCQPGSAGSCRPCAECRPVGATVFHSVSTTWRRRSRNAGLNSTPATSARRSTCSQWLTVPLVVAGGALARVAVLLHQDAHLVLEVGRREGTELGELLDLREVEPGLVEAEEGVQPPVVARAAERLLVPRARPLPLGPRLLDQPAEQRHERFVRALGTRRRGP